MNCPICQAINPAGSALCHACAAPLFARDAADALPGGARLLGGAYVVERVLGQGGFGITYLGRDVNLGRPVAIKEFFPAGCARQGAAVQAARAWSEAEFERARAGFLAEARLLARFRHPGIVHVYACFAENATAYMVMEWLQGQTLQQLVEAGGPLPVDEAVGYAVQLGAALEAVHGAELLHRDIKPDNVLRCAAERNAEKRVVLLDFGTAGASQTAGAPVLTPGYAPLEQYGHAARCGVFTDLYALGATLYFLLTGQALPPATDRAAGVEVVPLHHLNPRLSRKLSDAVLWALEVPVDRRPASVREFVARLQDASTPPLTAFPVQPRPVASRLPTLPPTVSSGWTVPPPPGRVPWTPAAQWTPVRRGVRHKALWWGLAAILALKAWVVFPSLPDEDMCGLDPSPSALSQPDGIPAQPPGGPSVPKAARRVTEAWIEAGTGVAFAPDGTRLASFFGNKITLRGWGAARRVRPLTWQVPVAMTSVAFSPNGRWLATGNRWGPLQLWDASTGKLLLSYRGSSLTTARGVFSPDGRWLVGANAVGHLDYWELASGQCRGTAMGAAPLTAIAFSPDSKLVACGDATGAMMLWNPVTGKSTWRDNPRSLIATMAFAPDGKSLATAEMAGGLKLWRDPARLAHGNAFFKAIPVVIVPPAPGHHWTAVAFAPDGTLLAGGAWDGTVRLWDARTLRLQRQMQAAPRLRQIAFAPDGKTLALCSEGVAEPRLVPL